MELLKHCEKSEASLENFKFTNLKDLSNDYFIF